MAFLFSRNKQKGPAELTRLAKDLIPKLDSSNPAKAEEFAKVMAGMKLILQGTQEVESSPLESQQLVHAILEEDILLLLAQNIQLFSFEARKDTQVVFSYVLRYKNPKTGDLPGIRYVTDERPEVILELCRGYDHRDCAGSCGTVLREILKHEKVVRIILYDEPGWAPDSWDEGKPNTGRGVFWDFFEWIDKGAFEVSTDAFTTFREIIVKHKKLSASYLLANYHRFFTSYDASLIHSASYVTKRQSIKLLGEILLDRSNYAIMTAYVAEGDHLKTAMQLLRDDRRMVQYEGFHVFKIFVANPHKSPAVRKILINNKQRLLRFLAKFLEDRTDDDQFQDERSFLICHIEALPDVYSEADDAAQQQQQQQQQQGIQGRGGQGAVVAGAR